MIRGRHLLGETRAVGGDHLLLLSPSAGYGGGIERVMDAVEDAWTGPVQRVDLLQGPPLRDRALDHRGSVTKAGTARFIARVVKSASLSRPDVVVCGLLGLLPVASAVALTCRSRLALLAYGIDVWGAIGPVERLLIKRCTHLLTISAFTSEVFATRVRLSPRNIEILALPIAESLETAAQCAVRVHSSREPIVLTVSRISKASPAKGHFDIARCFPRVLGQRPDARWVVVGDGDDLPRLRLECERLGINDAVSFTGRVSDAELVSLYRSASIFALPSFANPDAEPPVGEGFGLVFAEAGAFGLPLIASEAGGGSADFVLDGETGLTVPPNAPDDLADAILRLLDSEELRSALGQRARALTLSRHLPAHFREALNRSLA